MKQSGASIEDRGYQRVDVRHWYEVEVGDMVGDSVVTKVDHEHRRIHTPECSWSHAFFENHILKQFWVRRRSQGTGNGEQGTGLEGKG